MIKGDLIMARTLKTKELTNTRLAANYGGWMYCDACNENIGYLCYSTYDRLKLNYQCNCGNCGSAVLDFDDSKDGNEENAELIIIKNRFCCPKDQEPFITILDKKVKSYQMEITCKSCGSIYYKEK